MEPALPCRTGTGPGRRRQSGTNRQAGASRVFQNPKRRDVQYPYRDGTYSRRSGRDGAAAPVARIGTGRACEDSSGHGGGASEAARLLTVRPLLDVTRADVLQYLRDRDIPWREDSSNRDLRFARNRIRHELLPQLTATWNPRLTDALAHLADLSYEEERWWAGPASPVEKIGGKAAPAGLNCMLIPWRRSLDPWPGERSGGLSRRPRGTCSRWNSNMWSECWNSPGGRRAKGASSYPVWTSGARSSGFGWRFRPAYRSLNPSCWRFLVPTCVRTESLCFDWSWPRPGEMGTKQSQPRRRTGRRDGRSRIRSRVRRVLH